MAIQIIFSRRLLELLYTNSHAMMKHRQSLPVPVQQSCSRKKNDNSEEQTHSDSFFTARGNAQRVLILSVSVRITKPVLFIFTP